MWVAPDNTRAMPEQYANSAEPRRGPFRSGTQAACGRSSAKGGRPRMGGESRFFVYCNRRLRKFQACLVERNHRNGVDWGKEKEA